MESCVQLFWKRQKFTDRHIRIPDIEVKYCDKKYHGREKIFYYEKKQGQRREKRREVEQQKET